MTSSSSVVYQLNHLFTFITQSTHMHTAAVETRFPLSLLWEIRFKFGQKLEPAAYDQSNRLQNEWDNERHTAENQTS